MKTSTLITILLLCSTAVFSQNIRVTFSGTVDNVIIDSVTATNLTTEESISLPGDATLLLSASAGISDLFTNTDINLVYPNPFPGDATIQAFSAEYQNLRIKILDLSGRIVVQTETLVNPGLSTFSLSLSTPGIYLATLVTSSGTRTQKLISISPGSTDRIQLLGSNQQHATWNMQPEPRTTQPATRNPQLKSSFTLGYTTGDLVQFECFSGDYYTVLTDSPAETKNYEVKFPPLAIFSVDPEESLYEERITLDASACKDAETHGEDLEVRWDFNGDSIWDTEFDQAKIMEHMFPLAGTYNIWMQVKDQAGMTDSVSFQVKITYPTFTDSRDGAVYHYKRIGEQYWMVENLAYLPEVSRSNDGSLYGKHFYVFGNENTVPVLAKQNPNFKEYGVLYNWPAALNGAESSDSVPSGVQGICPSGWHLPSDGEFKELELYLGMNLDDVNLFYAARKSGSVGGKLKEKGTAHWNSPNTGATNSCGFTARPAGKRDYSGGFAELGSVTSFWSSTGYDNDDAYYRAMANFEVGIFRYAIFYSYGLSVRCIKD